MPGREQRIDRANVQVTRALDAIGREIHDGRLGAGLTLQAVGNAIGRSSSELSRIEHGQASNVPYRTLALAAATVGLDLPLRTFPAGEPIRDKAQVALLSRFRIRLPPGLTWRTEVPLNLPGDRRAWDAVIGGGSWTVMVDAETRLYDIQALARRVALKRRDAEAEVVVLLVADTRHNRSVLRLARADLAAEFPLSSTEVLAALESGRRPRGSAIVLL